MSVMRKQRAMAKINSESVSSLPMGTFKKKSFLKITGGWENEIKLWVKKWEISRKNGLTGGKKKSVTGDSCVVPHRGTSPAHCCLTSQFRRDTVLSARYERIMSAGNGGLYLLFCVRHQTKKSVIRASHKVPHCSTNLTHCSLTAQFRRDTVLSARYERIMGQN